MVTDYMIQDDFRNPDGNIRDIIINELGVDRTQGDDIQAAAICAAYVAFKRNPYITQFMYVDTVGYGVDLRLKGQAYKAFKALGTSKEQEYIDWALEYIGASKWDDILDLYPEDYILLYIPPAIKFYYNLILLIPSQGYRILLVSSNIHRILLVIILLQHP